MSLASSAPPSEPDWRPAVSVREDPDLARVLTARLRPPGDPRRVSVTDLLSPRAAYWRRASGPVPMLPDRQLALEGGRRLHRILGIVFAGQGQLEVRVHGEVVQGRVDVMADCPVEIKTGGYPPPATDPVTERPDHVDQVAMYSALVGVDRARLVYLQTDGDEIVRTAAYDVAFGSVDPIRAAMAVRTRALTGAWTKRSAHGLPRCPWYARGCEFRGAEVCDCTGEEAVPDPVAGGAAARSSARPDLATSLERAVRSRLAKAPRSTIRRFGDLLYPRRAFFDGLSAARPASPVKSEGETDTYPRLVEAVDGGPLGEATRLPTLSDEPDEDVGGFRGTPVLVRTSRASRRLDPLSVVEAAPQYALQLGFRCVATGTDRGRLVVGYERGAESDRVQVLEYRFDPSSTFSRVWRARARNLALARDRGDPSELEACPSWMFERCPYRDRCGCGSTTGRSQR